MKRKQKISKAHTGQTARNKGKNNPNYIDGRSLKKYYCKVCGKKISTVCGAYGSKMCMSCSCKKRLKNPKNNTRYIDGRTNATYYCIEKNCNNKICYNNWLYGQRRCRSCSQTINRLKSWQNKEYRNKKVKQWIKGNQIRPTKPEIQLKNILKDLLPRQYKYVGDGKIIISGFNPDFINKKNKKIIEMYGDYHHNLPKVKQRDLRRKKEYKKEGYQLLIIWQKELKNIKKVKNKILKFATKGE